MKAQFLISTAAVDVNPPLRGAHGATVAARNQKAIVELLLRANNVHIHIEDTDTCWPHRPSLGWSRRDSFLRWPHLVASNV
jgi:hypothetical protein